MRKINVSLQEDVHEDLMKLVPARKRSEVINAALRKELLQRKRELAAARIKHLRRRSAIFTGRELVEAVKKGRSKVVGGGACPPATGEDRRPAEN